MLNKKIVVLVLSAAALAGCSSMENGMESGMHNNMQKTSAIMGDTGGMVVGEKYGFSSTAGEMVDVVVAETM